MFNYFLSHFTFRLAVFISASHISLLLQFFWLQFKTLYVVLQEAGVAQVRLYVPDTQDALYLKGSLQIVKILLMLRFGADICRRKIFWSTYRNLSYNNKKFLLFYAIEFLQYNLSAFTNRFLENIPRNKNTWVGDWMCDAYT